jgi:exosome complex RNA-binding protein Rrp42 (RNase PH superfamily)
LKYKQMMQMIGSISSADGSSVVRIGATHVICGLKLEVGKPIDLAPRAGRIGMRTHYFVVSH